MDQLQLNDQALVTTPPRFDTIPEDAALEIAKVIQSWTEIDGSLEEREKARRARDSTLRAISLSCRSSFALFHSILLSDVTISTRDIISFHHALERDQDFGRLIKRFQFCGPGNGGQRENRWICEQVSSFSSIASSEEAPPLVGQNRVVTSRMVDGLKILLHSIYQKLVNLQTLLALYPDSVPKFQHISNGRSVTLPLFNSIKEIVIKRWTRDVYFSVQNVVWILVFCPTLIDAILSFNIVSSDFSNLSEHASLLTGLSNVKRLALNFAFVYKKDLKSTWWGSASETSKIWKGNKKTDTVSLLLSILKNLTSLELFMEAQGPKNTGDDTALFLGCLGALNHSRDTLTHLRILDFGYDGVGPDANLSLFSQFRHLRVLCLNLSLLAGLERFQEIELPSSLTVIHFPFFTFSSKVAIEDHPDEDVGLTSFLHYRSVPSLKEVIVPSSPVDQSGKVCDWEPFLERWQQSRRHLERASLFRSGKVKLRKIAVGEKVGEPSQGEGFGSSVDWLA